MSWVLWAVAGWVALSVLVVPVVVRLCRCMARFDPPREQLAAAAAGSEATFALPWGALLVERRSGGDRHRRAGNAPLRRHSDSAALLG